MPNAPPIERCIVADDDPVIQAILRSTLAGIGLGVHLASTGEEAIALAGRNKVGLFMLDLLMPGLNGLDTCRRLRALPNHANTPIVILTGHTNTRTRAAAQAAGATLFIVKPFKPAMLLQTLGPLLGRAAPDAPSQPADRWGQVDPAYRDKLWGRLDAERAAARQAKGLDLDLK